MWRINNCNAAMAAMGQVTRRMTPSSFNQVAVLHPILRRQFLHNRSGAGGGGLLNSNKNNQKNEGHNGASTAATTPSSGEAASTPATPATHPARRYVPPHPESATGGGSSEAYDVSPPADFLSGISQLINASRTTTTKGLWEMRKQERKDMDSHLAVRQGSRTPITPIEARSAGSDPSVGDGSGKPSPNTRVKPVNPFPPIMPFDSFWSVSLPFDTDLSLFDDYVRFDGGVRFERILEDLDAFAGNVAHLHVKKGIQRLNDIAAAKGEQPSALPDLSIVTASVDGITMNPKRRFPMDKHLALQGCTTWVGNSSMEIWIEIRIVRDPAAWGRMTLAEKMAASTDATGDDVVLNAFFLMVARDQKSGKAAFVPPLDVANMSRDDKLRFDRGEVSAIRRKHEAANSLTRTPPTEDEVKLIHPLIMGEEAAGGGSSSSGTSSSSPATSSSTVNNVLNSPGLNSLTASPALNLEISSAPSGLPGAVIIRPKQVVMGNTEISSATLTMPQDRNTVSLRRFAVYPLISNCLNHLFPFTPRNLIVMLIAMLLFVFSCGLNSYIKNGKIFGGYLMRNAYELARCNAYLFCGANSSPFFIAVDTMSFLRPVEIGSIISFRSKICYAAGHPDSVFQIRVETLVHDLIKGNVYPSNSFHFTFQCTKVPVRKVVPLTYREAIDYLDGKRRREKLAKKFKEIEEEDARRNGKPRQASASLVDASQETSQQRYQ